MNYILTCPFWITVYEWQTLIAGVLAVIAALLTIRATNEAASLEISAAQEQTAASLKQTEVTLDLDRRRTAREGYAFHAMLSASMASILEDATKSRELFAKEPHGGVDSRSTYPARQKVKKMAFEELRNACIRFGGELTAPLLRLEKEIDFFAAQWIPLGSAGDNIINQCISKNTFRRHSAGMVSGRRNVFYLGSFADCA